MAVLERSATMGVIVAAPTAGSAGVVPGCVLALADHLQLDDEQVMDALYCAAAIGLNLTTSACVAGAEGGCQAEVGSAAAMAAAALVQMMGGTPEQALDASSIALSNLLPSFATPSVALSRCPAKTATPSAWPRPLAQRNSPSPASRAWYRLTRWRTSCSRWATPCLPRCARRPRAASRRLQRRFRRAQNAEYADSEQKRTIGGTYVPPIVYRHCFRNTSNCLIAIIQAQLKHDEPQGETRRKYTRCRKSTAAN